MKTKTKTAAGVELNFARMPALRRAFLEAFKYLLF